jgi:multiple sugar transport system substrate-binding protein
MTIGPWIIRSVKDLSTYPHSFTTAFAPYPVSRYGTRVYEQGGLGDHLSICPTSMHSEAAWKFIQWYAESGILSMVPGGRIPAYTGFDRKTIMDSLMKNADDLLDKESAEEILVTPRKNFAIPSLTTRLSQISGVLNTHMERIFTGAEPVEDGLGAAKREGDAWLKGAAS